MNLFTSLFGRKRKVPSSPLGSVEFDELQVCYLHGDRADQLAWHDLIEVGILTTDEGPFQEDVFFMLLGPSKEIGCAIPQGADGSQKLFERLQQLPGFDHESAIKAMSSTSNNRFICWQKKNA